MTNVVLEARGVGMIFGSGHLALRALHPTDFRIAPGEVVVVMGPSGSGKTTLLSILGLVLTPTEGEVLVHGNRVPAVAADARAALRRDAIGFVFQQFNLLAGLSAIDNVALPLLLRGAPAAEREARARVALAAVSMSKRERAKARSLSGGEQQRVAIARAFAGGAEVLLCDEPTASLDGRTGHEVLDTLAELARAHGRAVVVVTHDERVLRIASRLIHVEDGHVREEKAHGSSV
jgi:putative ABC transport system ATP-binding protein